MGVILFRMSRKRSGSNNGSEESGSTHALSKSETELFITPHHSQNPLECLVLYTLREITYPLTFDDEPFWPLPLNSLQITHL